METNSAHRSPVSRTCWVLGVGLALVVSFVLMVLLGAFHGFGIVLWLLLGALAGTALAKHCAARGGDLWGIGRALRLHKAEREGKLTVSHAASVATDMTEDATTVDRSTRDTVEPLPGPLANMAREGKLKGEAPASASSHGATSPAAEVLSGKPPERPVATDPVGAVRRMAGQGAAEPRSTSGPTTARSGQETSEASRDQHAAGATGGGSREALESGGTSGAAKDRSEGSGTTPPGGPGATTSVPAGGGADITKAGVAGDSPASTPLAPGAEPKVGEQQAIGETPAAAGGGTPPMPGESAANKARPEGEDDLQRISGIGPQAAAKLKELGVTRFSEIASWTDDDIDRMERQLGGISGRIRRDNWVEQAKTLANG